MLDQFQPVLDRTRLLAVANLEFDEPSHGRRTLFALPEIDCDLPRSE